jgi:carbon monoxide dehydrogenase subunit G
MFKVKATYNEQFEVKATAESVRQFFANTRNFVELMPNIESIRTEAKGTARWTIRAEIPLLGAMIESFSVQLSENSENLIEYTPAVTETKNYLRYAADFKEGAAGKTTVNISQTVELRRAKAADLHFLAGLAGEKIISQQMQSRVAAMIKTFLEKARTKLEQN